MIYFDNAATTFPKPEAVYYEMDKVNRELAVNAGRGSYKAARNASELISDTKSKLRSLVHADISASIVFSPSVTVAMNQIINGIKLTNNSVIYVSPYEHNAVARTLHKLSKDTNIVIKQMPIDENLYEINIEKLKYEFSKEKPDAVFCTHISNVTGYILPIKEIFYEAKKYHCVTVLDAAQSIGLVDFDVNQIDVDIIAFAGHKTLYGPFGIGGFINVAGVSLDEFITGGTGSDSLNLEMPEGLESKYEAASMNIVAIAGLNKALEIIDISELLRKERELSDYLIQNLQNIRGVKLFVPENRDAHVGIVSFVVEGFNSEDIGVILDEDFDIAVRTGFHCAPYIHKFLRDEKYLGTVRVGLGQFNTRQQIDELIVALKDVIEG